MPDMATDSAKFLRSTKPQNGAQPTAVAVVVVVVVDMVDIAAAKAPLLLALGCCL